MATTTNYNLILPTNGGDSNNWGLDTNTNWVAIDADLFAVSGVASAALPATGGTMTGALNAKTGTAAYTAVTGNSSTTIDLSAANCFLLTVTGACALTLTNVPAITATVVPLIFKVVNGGTNVTWPAAMKWANGAGAPALTASGTDMLAFISFDQGVTWDEMGFQQNVS